MRPLISCWLQFPPFPAPWRNHKCDVVCCEGFNNRNHEADSLNSLKTWKTTLPDDVGVEILFASLDFCAPLVFVSFQAHICLQVCGRPLSCGNHTCEDGKVSSFFHSYKLRRYCGIGSCQWLYSYWGVLPLGQLPTVQSSLWWWQGEVGTTPPTSKKLREGGNFLQNDSVLANWSLLVLLEPHSKICIWGFFPFFNLVNCVRYFLRRCRVVIHEPIFCACGKNSIEPPSDGVPSEFVLGLGLLLLVVVVVAAAAVVGCWLLLLVVGCCCSCCCSSEEEKQLQYNDVWWRCPKACGTDPPSCQEPCAQLFGPSAGDLRHLSGHRDVF